MAVTMTTPLSVAEAARQMGKSARYVRQLAKAGRLVGAYRVGWAWVIPTPVKVLPVKKG